MSIHQHRFLSLIIPCICGAIVMSGCSLSGGPRGRWGWTPEVQPGDPNRLGTHSYGFSGSEGFGIFYTLRGGSIDLDHVRGTADLTRWTYMRAYATLKKGDSKFTVSPAFEWTTNKIEFQYPPDWSKRTQNEKDNIAHQAALILAPVVGYNSMIWHEMLTWKGTHFMLFEPEFTSAFSWDDLYSDLMGVELAMQAIRDGDVKEDAYNQAMTELIQKEFERLEVVSKTKAIEITKSVKGSWYLGGK